MKTTNGIRYGIKSQNKYEINRRAKRKGLSVEDLIKQERLEQEFLDKGLKFCISCKEWKNFGKSAAYCKTCCSTKTRSRYDKVKERNYWLNKKFGISLEVYQNMQIKQNYKCYICQTHEDNLDRSLAVDHCHITGKVRGLLCGNCNRFLGQINDNIETAKRLVMYLQEYKTI